MKHSQSLPTTAWSTTQTWDSSIPDTLRACTNIGKLFTLILAIFILGNTNIQAQITCAADVTETISTNATQSNTVVPTPSVGSCTGDLVVTSTSIPANLLPGSLPFTITGSGFVISSGLGTGSYTITYEVDGCPGTPTQNCTQAVNVVKGPLDASESYCDHPADTNGSSDDETVGVVTGSNPYVDVNNNGIRETEDGDYVSLLTADCDDDIYNGTIVSGGTYGFALNTGSFYTFEVCGVTSDIYPLMDLWLDRAESSGTTPTDLAAISTTPVSSNGQTCVSMSYLALDNEVFLNVNSQVHGNTCEADWKPWTLSVNCEECELTVEPDIYISAADNGGSCNASAITVQFPAVSGPCQNTITITATDLPGGTPTVMGSTGQPGQMVTYTGPFATGSYFITYSVMDCAGNMVQRTQNVFIEPVMVCNDEVNVTLGPNCKVAITADMIIEAPCLDDDDYAVTIVGFEDNVICSPGTYTVKVEFAPGGVLSGIYCWGTVNAEDKTGPTCVLEEECYIGFCGVEVDDLFTSPPVFSDCTGLANDTIIFDQAFGSCGMYEGSAISLTDGNSNGLIDVFEADGIFIPLPCQNPGTGFTLDNIVIRTWQISDVLGNGSVSCRAFAYYFRPSVIYAPISLIDTLECLSGVDAATLAAINPQFVPHFVDNLGVVRPLIDGSHSSCKYSVIFNDIPLLDLCGDTQKFIREWTVLDWCTGNIVNACEPFNAAGPNCTQSIALNQYTQIIKTIDTTAPVWTNCPNSDPDNDATTDDAQPGSTMANPLTLNSSSSSADNCFFFGTLNAPTATDACGDAAITYSAEVYNTNNGLDYIIQDLSQPAQIGFGLRRVVFIATDDCGNRAECPIFYNVLDDDQPIAICDQFTTVSLTNAQNGGARICADNLDSGSYDNCAITSRTVRRMDADEATPFTDCIDLTCADAANSPIMVVMRVADAAGNFNDCMVEVEVQDKIGPFLTCPADVTITCTDDINDLALTGNVVVGTSPATLGGGFTFDNCGETLQPTYQDDLVNLACGAGVVTRTWTVDSNGSTVSCQQSITITSINSFRVEFPRDTTITTCTSPDQLGDFGAPIITNDICAQVGVGSTDVQFDVVTGACYKILRTWTVVNWCNYDDESLLNTASGNPVDGLDLTFDDDGDGFFRYTQVIKVQDAVAPVFSPYVGQTAFLNTTDECGGTVNIQVAANDSCSDDISYEYLIDANNDSTFEPSLSGTGPAVDPTVVFPYGTHRVLFVAEDGCGNTASQEIVFSIADNKAPSIACKHLSVTLMPQVNMIELWASDYVEMSGVLDNCTPTEDLVYGIIRESESDQVTPPTGTNITFDCTDLQVDTNGDGIPDDAPISAEVEVEIWIGDTDGNWTFCTATTTVFANDDGCDPNPDDARVMVAGNLKNEFGNDLEDVTIEISSEASMWDYTTENDGHYEIDELPMYTDFTVTPENDTNPLNGVSTYDLVLLSQHILGINELDSPYTMIAADVNNNGTITTADIVELRQMILYITSDFQNNKSWRFVDASFVFPDQTNPFTTSFPEVRNLSALENNAMAENFVGIKVGDLNGDAVANSILGAEDRNLVGAFTMKANDQLVAAGEEVVLTLTSEDLATVEGFQFTLNFDATALEFEEVGNSDLAGFTTGNFGYSFLDEGVLTASWNKVADVEDANQVVELIFTAKDDITLSEVISLSSRYTKAEAYDSDMNDMNVGLEFNTTNGTVITAAGFELYQNQPNPFSNETSIGFTLPEAAQASLTIYDVEGRELRVITNSFAKGYNQFTVDNKNLVGGVLYYRLDTPTHSATKKMIVIK